MKEKQKVVEVTPADDPNTGDEEDKGDRETWDNQCEFFLSCLGYAVGFGNVWRFPYLCYKNGGAIFLIPYVVMLLCAGLPLFFLELSLGQFSSLGPNKLFLHLAPVFMGLGWGMLMISLMVAIYYNVILAWALYYTFASFTSVLPWGHCDNDFNSVNCFTRHESEACQNQSLQYYNRSCITSESYCALSNLTLFNETDCTNGENETIPMTSSLKTITASEDFFKNRMLGLYDGISWENMGGLNWELVGCLALAWLIVGACMIKGVKSSGKVVYFTAIFPYVVLVILFVRGITLEGAYKGIEFYILKPNMTRLSEPEVWNDAAAQIFFSLSTAFGGLITLASYNGFRVNCMRDAIVICLSNCLTSVFAGFVIFSILGFMAHSAGVEVTDVVSSGSGLAFIAYPAAVTMMPVPPLWSCLFFFMFITLGLDSQFAFVETLTTGLFDQFPALRERKPLVVASLCGFLFLCGLSFCLEGGAYMFELFNWFSGWLAVIVFAVLEVVTVAYVYGFKRFMKNISEEMGVYIPKFMYYYWASTWLVLTPGVLTVIFIFSIYFYTPAYYGDYVYPPAVQGLGWCLVMAALLCLPAAAIYQACWKKLSWAELRGPCPDFVPAHTLALLQKTEGAKKGSEPSIRYIYDNDGFNNGQAMVINNDVPGATPYYGH